MMCQNLYIFRHDIDTDSSTDEELSDNEASSDEVRCPRSVFYIFVGTCHTSGSGWIHVIQLVLDPHA